MGIKEPGFCSKVSLDRFPPQILYDTPKARREMELHCRALAGPHIVRVLSLYENLHQGRRCLLMVMEW